MMDANQPMMRPYSTDLSRFVDDLCPVNMNVFHSTSLSSQILLFLCARLGARSFARTEGPNSEFLAAKMKGQEMKDDMTGASQSRRCGLHSAVC